MTFEEKYEQNIANFVSSRREMLGLMSSIVPTAADMHRRKWRIQQLDNAIFDIKTTFAACNAQLDKERGILEELTGEYERMYAQERKLKEDIKLLEGVTGIPAIMPCDAHSGLSGEIDQMSQDFRENFANFYFELPPLNQEVPVHKDFEKEGHILVETLRDYVNLKFENRAADAEFAKISEERSILADKMEKELSDNVMKIEREIETNRRQIEDGAGETKDKLMAQTKELRQQGKTISTELIKAQTNLGNRVHSAKAAKERLSSRCSNLATQRLAIKESLRRRGQEIELELDRLENRMEVIRRAPTSVDKRMMNIALVVGDRSKKIDRAVAKMRQDLAAFNAWLRD